MDRKIKFTHIKPIVKFNEVKRNISGDLTFVGLNNIFMG